MKRYSKILNILTLVFFMALLVLPSVNKDVNLIKEEENSENRTIVPKPEFKDTLLEEYFKQYDAYYTDNFSLRNNFILLLNKLQFNLFDASSVPDRVTVGKDGWFYEAGCAANYKGANKFTAKELEKYRNEIIKRTKWAARRNVKYYLVIVPNKMSIYPEYLPRQVIKVSEVTRYDQVAAMNNDSTINVIDLRKNLLAHKNEGHEIFQRTDDHWNELGAYYGYQEIMKNLSKKDRDLQPIPLDKFVIGTEERTGNMARMLNVEKEFPEHFVKLTEKYTPQGHDGVKRGYKTLPRIAPEEYEFVKENNSKKLKCLIIRDSFTILMIKFLQEHFGTCVIIHDEWMYRMREELVVKERPDIILNIVLETNLQKLLEYPFQLDVNQPVEQKVSITGPDGKYVCAEPTGTVIENREAAGAWEEFTMVTYDNSWCAFLAWNKTYFSAELNGTKEIFSSVETPSDWEKFQITDIGNGQSALKASNGKYVSYDEISKKLYCTAETVGPKEKFVIRKLGK